MDKEKQTCLHSTFNSWDWNQDKIDLLSDLVSYQIKERMLLNKWIGCIWQIENFGWMDFTMIKGYKWIYIRHKSLQRSRITWWKFHSTDQSNWYEKVLFISFWVLCCPMPVCFMILAALIHTKAKAKSLTAPLVPSRWAGEKGNSSFTDAKEHLEKLSNEFTMLLCSSGNTEWQNKSKQFWLPGSKAKLLYQKVESCSCPL